MERTAANIAGIVGSGAGLPSIRRPRLSIGTIASALVVLVALALGALCVGRVLWWVAPGELIWPVPADAYAITVFLVTFLGILAAARLVSRRRNAPRFRSTARRGGRLDAIVGGPVVLLIAVSAAARIGTQAVGFVGLHPVPVLVNFTVVGTTTTRGRHDSHDRYLLRLRYGSEGRTFNDEVARPVYDAAREGDTVVLPVETGRFGLQRAMIADGLTVADLHHASQQGG